ncbi:23S rRNA (uracil(1939)-C(5))-methyltransferase RlmD [Aestuariibacter halophilus]|uniref:23S rRNA (Uracil(1939)-C(5))-methyltransferase RlmD n=1 Tax=Fluctibacter halophilus TaxID=226011 RepID=A0ABS8GDB8_9ALTE|nr:23S rRNA (uracil(1939)-C(5))-methyltransferase RlmD [Aestuariibacter halophilus]MCC2617784.1 23S rRNA (uracil(1939)-C(5))-methyltransferase RlmD [Aestuariibacter halophilus]
MARVFKPGKQPARNLPATVNHVEIDHWDHRGVGVVPGHQPVLFVNGALPGERVDVRVDDRQKRLWRGHVSHIHSPSPDRITPVCPLFGRCGGCQLQHVDPERALVHKQSALTSLLQRQCALADVPWQAPLSGQPLAYRRKTRLAVDARRPDQRLLGFRGQSSKTVVDVDSCPILEPQLNALLLPLHRVLDDLKAPMAIGHISLLSGENRVQVSVRLTRTVGEADIALWREFAQQHECRVLLEHSDENHTVLGDDDAPMTYSPDGELHLTVTDSDFLQVNRQINQRMVAQAAHWLDLQPSDRLLDLYCGLGNFSLPLAGHCEQVLGIEGITTMVHRAHSNALKNGIDNARFDVADLSQPEQLAAPISDNGFNKVLLDPAREGAYETCQSLANSHHSHVLYVSCNPATFVRDARVLLDGPFTLEKIGLMDMFPQTAHTELMALFVRKH